MSEFPWPHPTHAEDQPYAKSLLYIHVFHRGFEAGGLIGTLLGGYKIYKRRQILKRNPLEVSEALGLAGNKNFGIMRTIFYPTMAWSSLIGAATTMVLLTGRMWGAEEVEWQDRSWRLLENEGQVRHDLYADVGAGVGAVSAVLGGASKLPASRMVREVVGRAGLGAVVGFVGCEVVRGYRRFTSNEGEKV